MAISWALHVLQVVPSTISTIAVVPAATATTAEPETVVGTPGVAVNVPGARPTDCTTRGCPADPSEFCMSGRITMLIYMYQLHMLIITLLAECNLLAGSLS